MKNYRMLAVVVLVALMFVSIYTMISDSAAQETHFADLKQKASQYYEDGLFAKAASVYAEIIEMDNKIDYYLKIIDMYYEAGETDACQAWCNKVTDEFPQDPTGYERLLRLYVEQGSPAKAFKVLDEVDARGLSSEAITAYRSQIDFLYYVEYISAESISQPCSGVAALYQDGSWGVISSKGNTIAMPQFTNVSCFANDMIAVCDEGLWYFMGSDGQYIYNVTNEITGNVADVGVYNDGLFPASNGEKFRYYNIQFENILSEYDFAGTFNNNVAAVYNNGKWQLINTEGKVITKATYEDIAVNERDICCVQDRIFVKENGAYYLIDSAGKRIGEEYFEQVCVFGNGNLAAVKQKGRWGFINTSGEVVISPKYDDAKSFSNGLAAVKIDGLWGYIDDTSAERIEPQYLSCTSFTEEGTAFAEKENGWNILKLYRSNH
ncbi:MAG: WG repeat-containing protein [Roseburia sp.]|nr:WG repeat-containing protein [Roseburia sp.]